MPKRRDINKVMVIGSGPIVIGQAAEFDYAGTQACLALKEEGYEVILVNSNPATIMTDTHIADKVYMEPLTLEYVAKIIRFERPDAIVPGLGGQTGLNLAVQLAKKGILNMSGCVCQEGSRCLQCSTVCENCVDSCPNRANVAIAMADGSHQILHVDKMCNECGNCTQFCPYASEPCHDKFTLFQTAEDMEDSHNAGVLFLEDGKVRVRLAGAPQEYNLDEANDLPRELETFILTIRDQYGYLFA